MTRGLVRIVIGSAEGSEKQVTPYCQLSKTELHSRKNDKIVKCHLISLCFHVVFDSMVAANIVRYLVLDANTLHLASLAVSLKPISITLGL